MELRDLFEYVIIPLAMILMGGFMYSNISGMNGFVGYRTRRSMSSQEMWDYAQKKREK